MVDVTSRPAAGEGTVDVASVDGQYIGEQATVRPVDTSRSEATHDHSPKRPPTERVVRDRELIVPVDQTVYSPFRQVSINGHPFDVERDITITAGEFGYPVATVTMWNLDVETWRSISREDSVRIELGWKQGDSEEVFDGEVVIKRPWKKRRDRAYTIRARSKEAPALLAPFIRSYTDMSPHFIVEDIIDNIPSIHRGYISTAAGEIEGNVSLTPGRDLSGWLDELATIAANQTGRHWVWYVDRGKLYFHPRTEPVSDVVTFDFNRSVLATRPAGSTTPIGNQDAHEVSMRCEPIVHRGMTTNIANSNSIRPEYVFRVASYVHESETTTGRHYTVAMVEPMDKTLDEVAL